MFWQILWGNTRAVFQGAQGSLPGAVSATLKARCVSLRVCGVCSFEAAWTSAVCPPAQGTFPGATSLDSPHGPPARSDRAGRQRLPDKAGPSWASVAEGRRSVLGLRPWRRALPLPLAPVLSRTSGTRRGVCRRAGAVRWPLRPPQAQPIHMWSIRRKLCSKKRFKTPR